MSRRPRGVSLRVYLPEACVAWLDAEAERTHGTRSEIVRRWIVDAMGVGARGLEPPADSDVTPLDAE